MQEAMKRVEELKQETIDKSKKIPNSESIVKNRLKEFSKFKSEVDRLQR